MESSVFQTIMTDVKKRKGSFLEGFNRIWRDVARGRAAAKNPGCSVVQLRAATLKELSEIVPLFVNPGWTLAGEHLIVHPGSAGGSGLNGEELREALAAVGLEGELAAIEAVRANYSSYCASAVSAGAAQADLQRGLASWGSPDPTGVYLALGWMENHSIRDYAKLLRVGFNGLAREIQSELDGHAITEPDYPQRANFLRAALFVCEAGSKLGARYAELASSLAERASSPAEKARLSAMAESCRRVPAEGATSFRDAVQCLWFGHLIACADDGINANSIGRLDQILNPYLERDLAKGVITRAEALDLMVEFAAKLYLEYDVQAITLGGVDEHGRCAVNEASYLILEATGVFGEIRDLSVRIDSKTPQKFLDACVKLVVRGGGIPFFFNDERFIPAMAERGIKLEDARGYAPIGCVELTIPGKANPRAVSGWINLLKCLEYALNDGVDPSTGKQVGATTGEFSSFKSFQDLFDAYKKQVEFFASRMILNCRRRALDQRSFGSLPAWSLLTDDCIKRGRDITDGGALYNYHSICLMGVPDVADSLAVLKKLVYEERSVSIDELRSALKANFKGFEELRKRLLNDVPKYGNGDPLPDGLAAELSNHFIDLMDSWSGPDDKLFVHLFTFLLNIDFGRKVGAMPDGRLAGEPLAYSLSAHQGRDLKGVTALFHSLALQPHGKAAAGSAAIIDLHPSALAGSKGEETLCNLVKTAVKMGIGQVQWNVVSEERLKKAKADPENYGNIAVRVAGYSQQFKLLAPDLQDHVIARHKHERF